MLSVPPRLRPPLITTRSPLVPSANRSCTPLLEMRSPLTVSVPGVALPGDSAPPDCKITDPPTVPLPASVPFADTVTRPGPTEPSIARVPRLTRVGPLYVFG